MAALTSFNLINKAASGEATPQPTMTPPPNPTSTPTPTPSPCTRANPTLSASPQSQYGVPGETLAYEISVTNNNSVGCSSTRYFMNATRPFAGWISTFTSGVLVIKPGQTLVTTLLVTSAPEAVSPGYPISVSTTGQEDGTFGNTFVSYLIRSSTPTPTATPAPTPTPIPTPTPTSAPNSSPIFVTGRMLPVARIYRAYRVNVVGYDVNAGDTLSMNISNLPKGLTQGACFTYLESGRRYISCPITGNASQLGLFGVRATLTDNRGGVSVKDFLLTVFP